MYNRDQFNTWVNEAPNQRYGAVYWECWQACAESKQAELDTLLQERNDAIQASMNDMSNLDKAKARIAQLEEALEYISTLHRYDVPADIADEALKQSPSTWLSEHDKEVKAKERERCALIADIQPHANSIASRIRELT